MSTLEIHYDATSLQASPDDGSALELIDGTNIDTFVRAFDDSTEEFVQGKFKVPGNLDLTGTVQFDVIVTAKTAASSKYVKHKFSHSAIGNNEVFDQSYSEKESADQAINAIQNTILSHSWSETISNLGWAVGDTIFFKYSRIAPSSSNLSGDLLLLNLIIKLPVV